MEFISAQDSKAWLKAHPQAQIYAADTGENFALGHWRSARLIDIDSWFAELYSHSLTHTQAWQQQFARAGIRRAQPVLLYDPGGMAFASVAAYVLDAFGVEEIAIIEGGARMLTAHYTGQDWQQGQPTALNPDLMRSIRKQPFPTAPASAFAPLIDAQKITAREPNKVWLFDNRSLPEYFGLEEAQDPRNGHIPGALAMPKAHFHDANGAILTVAQTQALLASYGAKSSSPIQLYCHGGGRSMFVALQLKNAGFTNVSVYLGSWADYAPRLELPVSAPPPHPASQPNHSK